MKPDRGALFVTILLSAFFAAGYFGCGGGLRGLSGATASTPESKPLFRAAPPVTTEGLLRRYRACARPGKSAAKCIRSERMYWIAANH
jgi:hypothetical protein